MKRDRPVFIGLTGPSGSGKTHVANKIIEGLASEGFEAKIIPMDMFHVENTIDLFRKLGTYDHPKFIDVPEIKRVLQDLSGRKTTKNILC